MTKKTAVSASGLTWVKAQRFDLGQSEGTILRITPGMRDRSAALNQH
jgi:hypothetical protein